MAYRFDQYDKSLVIDGWQSGIAPNPYDGISDMRNVLAFSVPGEISVGFSTGSVSAVISAGTVTALAAGSGTTVVFTGATGLENNMAISFTSVASYTGISAGTTVYWIGVLGGSQFSMFSDYQLLNIVTLSGSGNAGFTVHSPNFSNYQGTQPNKVTRSSNSGVVYILDSKGKVWSNKRLTSVNNYWTYIGNVPHSGSFIGDNSNGNGIVFYQASSSGSTNAYILVFSDSSIDYFNESTFTVSHGWNPATGTTGQSAPYLNSGAASGNSHDSLVGQDNVVYYCDGSFVGSFFEKSGQTFSPTNTATYTFNSKALGLPSIETATCLAELGVNLLVGGIRNLIYPWNRTGTIQGNSILNSYTYPIWLSESNVQRIVTVNTNAYIFVGNRGRIHITNGSQAQPWLKIPDHLSGTVEPYYVWGGVVANKNQLYFSVAATNNDGTANTNYGAIWAVDLEHRGMRVVNQMSYNSYAGLATAIYAITPLPTLVTNPSGAGLYMGWCSGSLIKSGNSIIFSGGSSGIDQTTSNPFTNSQAYIDSDLIPIGTFDQPRNFQRIEYLLTKPLVSGESISLQYRTDFSQGFTTIATDSTAGNFTNGWPVSFSNTKWIQIRAVLNSTTTNPSYVRLKQIRLTGLVQ